MYMVTLLVYLLSAGQSLGEPFSMNSKVSFVGEDKCTAYLQSDEFQQHKLGLYSSIRSRLQTYQSLGVNDLPEVSITASCVEDNRV